MNIINRKLSLDEFKAYIKSFNFSPLNPTKIVLHHTWRPTTQEWQSQKSINGLKSFYEGKGWSAGPHLFIGEDGIWLFSPMNLVGIHAGEGNTKSIGIEVVGDYDDQVWSGKTRENVIGVVKVLMEHLSIKDNGIHFHREYSSKSCPGNAIKIDWVLNELRGDPGLDKALEEAKNAYDQKEKLAWDAVNEWNKARAAYALLKGVPIKKYTIISE